MSVEEKMHERILLDNASRGYKSWTRKSINGFDKDQTKLA